MLRGRVVRARQDASGIRVQTVQHRLAGLRCLDCFHSWRALGMHLGHDEREPAGLFVHGAIAACIQEPHKPAAKASLGSRLLGVQDLSCSVNNAQTAATSTLCMRELQYCDSAYDMV